MESPREHTVQEGETFYRISKIYGVSLDRLMAANPEVDPKRLSIGQVIIVPWPPLPR